MWFGILFLVILFGGAITMLFMLYKWYQALGIILLCVIASIIAEIFNFQFDWYSYILGYVLCIISHTNIKIDKE